MSRCYNKYGDYMFYLIFGIIWTLFTSIFVFAFCGSMFSYTSINGEPGRLSFNFNPELLIPSLIIAVFLIVGIYLIVKGARQVIRDSKTKKYGIPCYGIVQNIKPTGVSINEQPEFKALLDIINPNTNQVENIEEVVGLNPNKYPIGSYVLCKYYEGDINFERIVQPSEISSSYRELLKPVNYTSGVPNEFMSYTNLEFSPDREYVTIDGVKYKKVY